MAKANAPERRQEPLVGVDRAKIHAAIGQVSQQLADVAPAGYDLTKLEDMAMAAIKTGRNMAQATMRSLLASLFHCAKVGLYPGDRQHCHLLSRKVKGTQTIQFQMGYQGYVELARRSGEIDKIEARVVHENDEFSWEYGTSPFIRHVGNLNPTPEKFKACYAVAKLAGVTEKQFVVMVPYEIAKIKECADITEWSPWVKWEASMWRKSAVIQLCKLLPASTELAYAVSRDQEVDAGLSQPDLPESHTGTQDEAEADSVDEVLNGE